MSDPTGFSHYCFTLLMSYIANTPEAMMLACVGGKTSPVTMAIWMLYTCMLIKTIPKHFSPTTGYWHFHEGISKLKQVTVCADAAPSGVIVAVCALLHFHYLVQSPRIDDHDIRRISAALAEFHANKHAIISAGVRQGKGRTVINNWHIPNLELMQNIVPSIHSSGVMGQWSVDITEHAHITEIKDPARSSNNNNYDPQICHHLNCADKCNQFELAMGLLDHGRGTEELEGVLEEFANENDETDGDMLRQREKGSVPVLLRSFVVGRTAFHLAYGPSIRSVTLDEVAVKFGLPDLRPAMADFLHREVTYDNHIHPIGGPRRAAHNAELLFDKVQVWFKIHLQETEFHDICNIRPAQTLNCAPPSNPWTLGHHDNIIIQTSTEHSWPASGLSGHSIAQLRLIMRPIGKNGMPWAWKDQFVAYVQCFDISSEHDPTTQLHILKRAKCSNGTRMGNIVPVSQLRAPVNLIPRFGAIADKHLTPYNSMEHATEFCKTVDYGMKMSSLMSAPYINDVHTMDKLTDHELHRLIIEEEEPPDNADEGPLSHMLAWIFRSFTVEVPDVMELKVPLHKIRYRDHRLHSKFALTDEHDLVPLFDKDEQQWNWALPISHLDAPHIDRTEGITGDGLGVENEMSGGGVSDSLLEGPSVGALQAQKHLFEEIFASFFNTICGVLAQKQPKIVTANSMVVRTWSSANATCAVKDEEVHRKPDLALLDDMTARWDTIKAVCKLTSQLYLPQSTVGKTIDSKAYLLLRRQPWRRFVLLLSLTNKYHDLNLNFYLYVLSCLVFGNPECIGYDPLILIFTKTLRPAQLECSPTFLRATTNKLPAADQTHRSLAESLVDGAIQVESTAPPQIRSTTPTMPSTPASASTSKAALASDPPEIEIPTDPLRTTPSQPIGKILVNDHAYDILELIFSSQGLVGCGTVCYLARRDDEEYIIKDHWVLGDKDIALNEVMMLQAMQGVRGVPQLIEYWLVEIGPEEVDETINYCGKIWKSIKGTSHIHSQQCHEGPLGVKCVLENRSDWQWLLHLWSADSFKEGSNEKTTFFFHLHVDKLREQFHPYFHDLLPLTVEWYELIRGKGPSQVMMFKEFIDLLNKHLDILPKDEPSLELLFVRKVIGGLPDGLSGGKRKAPSEAVNNEYLPIMEHNTTFGGRVLWTMEPVPQPKRTRTT
ncbi:hypothetical protein DFH29DRAFT_881277 [Suillus ampliporus]|nr:hypothetical protein DFH29DRAFT_881277 [Suillus ampliporus]